MRAEVTIKVSPKSVVILSGLALTGFVLCYVTATKPVWSRTLAVQSGDAALTLDYNPKAAARWYEEAHEADPYSPEPLERLADLHFQNWRQRDADRDFEQAVDSLRKAIPLDPASHRIYGELGRMSFARAGRLSSSEDAKLAVEYFTEAAARYPSSAWLRAELALALEQAGQSEEAVRVATVALELDQISRKAGHVDKFLPEELVKKLEAMTE
jgi:tetratricopeptide (TPR) repeat protein